MKPEVRAIFPTFTDNFEGKCAWMYLDVLGLVTTGRGNLIDPEPAAHALPWKLRDAATTLATPAQVSAEWARVKSFQGMKQRGGLAFAAVTTLRLTQADIDALTWAKLDQLAGQLQAVPAFAAFEDWPAPAQLGLLSMAWAMGAGFAPEFPHFCQAAAAQDWLVCAGPDGDPNTVLTARGQAWMRDGTPGQLTANENPGLRKRNVANKHLFQAATRCPDVLAQALTSHTPVT